MDKEVKIPLRKLFLFSRRVQWTYFENFIGAEFGIPSTAKKPEFDVIIKIKEDGQTD